MLFYLFTKFYIHNYKCYIVCDRKNKKVNKLLLDFANMIEVDL